VVGRRAHEEQQQVAGGVAAPVGDRHEEPLHEVGAEVMDVSGVLQLGLAQALRQDEVAGRGGVGNMQRMNSIASSMNFEFTPVCRM
jgi:hypothetical protein